MMSPGGRDGDAGATEQPDKVATDNIDKIGDDIALLRGMLDEYKAIVERDEAQMELRFIHGDGSRVPVGILSQDDVPPDTQDRGGMVVPPHIAKQAFAAARRRERERKIMRGLLLIQTTAWITLLAYALWMGRANLSTFLLLLFLGASVGRLAIVRRSTKKAPRYVARWGVERRGKGIG